MITTVKTLKLENIRKYRKQRLKQLIICYVKAGLILDTLTGLI